MLDLTVSKIEMEEFEKTTLSDYEEFERKSWAKKDGYKSPNFPAIEKYLEGMTSGMYVFAAESNVGKSAIMSNLQYDICTYAPNKLFGLYYSLDDSKEEIIPRIIAMDQSIPISACAKPQRYQNLIDAGDENSDIYIEYLEKRTIGLEKLKGFNNLLKIEDSSKIKCAEDIYKHMKYVLTYFKAIDPEYNILVAIDSLNDIRISSMRFNSNVEKHSEVARMVKEWTVEFDIPIFVSTHLRKLNQNRRPTLDDLKETGEIVYEASVVWLLYNDVSKNKQAANIYFNGEDELKRPVIEFDWAKNKKSSYKGRTFAYFYPEYSKARECDEDSIKRYEALVYES